MIHLLKLVDYLLVQADKPWFKVCLPVREIIHLLKLVDYILVKANKPWYKVCLPVWEIFHSLKLVDYHLVQADKPWYYYYLSTPAGRLGGRCLNGRCRGRNVRCNRSTDMCTCKRGCGDPAAVCLRSKSFFFCLRFFFYFYKGGGCNFYDLVFASLGVKARPKRGYP